jgi:hypothetical protein
MKERKTLGKEMNAMYLSVRCSQLRVGYGSIQPITYARITENDKKKLQVHSRRCVIVIQRMLAVTHVPSSRMPHEACTFTYIIP